MSPEKQALLKIRELKRQLDEARRGGPIAIVSMACRFPRASRTPEEFWNRLLDGSDESSEIPGERWDLPAFYNEDPEAPGKMYARRGAFLEGLDLMDPEFFGISPREATWVDPQQRLLMETAWEAIERAAWPVERIGARTGVFVGWMHNDYQNEASDSFLNLNPYIATGAAGSFLSGRLAYSLGLNGPSLAVDTACSSSLVALHLACQSLHRGDCDRALAGGVNAIVSPTTNILTCKLKALSPKGQSRAFDAAADGYLRGEGCGVVTLRRLEDALRDRDPIVGVIRGTAVGHNGRSGGLTVPHPAAQQRVIEEALRRAGVDACEVSYLEAHGTGTELGDPLEIQAAAAALCANRPAESPLLVGSVKTNIGHLEAAAGMAGLIKTVLALGHRVIPKQLHFDTPNPHIAWESLPLRVVAQTTPWPDVQRPIAGVSAFGMSGTNAHAIVEAPDYYLASPRARSASVASLGLPEAADGPDESSAIPRDQEPLLIAVSGDSEQAVAAVAEKMARTLTTEPSLALTDVAYTSCVGRSHRQQRSVVVVRSRDEAERALGAVARSGSDDRIVRGAANPQVKVAWQFTGQGAQFAGMTRGLYEQDDVFRAAIDDCDQKARELRDESLIDVLFADDGRINNTRWTQPAIFAVQMGLVRRLEAWGLKPHAVMGHSVGQYAAACVAGMISWEEGWRLICERGRLIGELPAGGKMLAVFAPDHQVREAVEAADSGSIAAYNGSHVVVSGRSEAIDAMRQWFDEQGVRTKELVTSHAFHSELMTPALAPFERFADQFDFQPGVIPLICNVTGKAKPADQRFDGAYWADHIRQAVCYADSVDALQELGCNVLLELGPQNVLTRMAAARWKGKAESLVSCLRHGVDDAEALLRSIAKLHVQGAAIDFEALWSGQDCRRVVLPTYPFQRRRFWGPAKPRVSQASYHGAHPLLGQQLSLADGGEERRFEQTIDANSPSWLGDHRVFSQPVVPGAAFLEMAHAASPADEIVESTFEKPLNLESRVRLQTAVRTEAEGQRRVEVFSAPDSGQGVGEWTRHYAAKLVGRDRTPPDAIDRASIEARTPREVDPQEFYAKLSALGLEYGPSFQTVEGLRCSESEVLARLNLRDDLRGFTVAPTLLDGALHAMAVGAILQDDIRLPLPVKLGSFKVFQPTGEAAWCHGRWKENEGPTWLADLTIFDESGAVLAEIMDLEVRPIETAALRRMGGKGRRRLVYETEWRPSQLPSAIERKTRWLLACHKDEAAQAEADRLADEIGRRGSEAVHLLLDSDADSLTGTDNRYRASGREVGDWRSLFQSKQGDESFPFDGVVWLAHETAPSSEPSTHAEPQITALLAMLSALRELEVSELRCGLLVATTAGVSVQGESVDPSQAQFWGLARVLGAEAGGLRCRLLDLPAQSGSVADVSDAIADLMLSETRDSQFALRGSTLFTPRLTPAPLDDAADPIALRPEACYLITGGLGALGRQTASWLVENRAKQIVLVSRRPPSVEAEQSIERLRESNCDVVVHLADLSNREQAAALFSRFGDDLKPLAGVIHAAGVVDDGLLADQTWERFRLVFAAKADAATYLDELTRELPLDFFVLYSSAASVLGSPGQSNYAAANAWLDGLAWRRRAEGRPALSVNWGPWTLGMAADERVVKRLAFQGVAPLEAAEANAVLHDLLAADATQATVIDADWGRMKAASGGELPALLGDLASTSGASSLGSEFVAKLQSLAAAGRREALIDALQTILGDVLSTTEKIDTQRPLIEMGLDSLMAVEFGAALQQLLGDGFAVNPTMLFDHPTIDAIADHVQALISFAQTPAEETPSEPTSVTPTEAPAREDVAVIGMACRFPGAENVAEFWRNLVDGVDSVSPIPDDRWDVERFLSDAPEPGKMTARAGGFLEDIGDFDAEFFQLSPQEAAWMDPQHRILLENSYRALEDAGIAVHPTVDPNVGVFVGVMGQDYAFLPSLDDPRIIEAFQGAGLSHSAGVGRISYTFGFEGPSVAVDSASSSSLVAVIQAVRSLQQGQCNVALAGGVNAILAPVNSLLMSKAGLLSKDGRCKSFSAAADGFGRGEGCGVVVLKRLSDARRDGDRVMAVIRGGSIVHNGSSGGITMPTSKAQARAIREALKDAGVAPSEVQYLEAHGTGTEFGDPMEISAAASVYGRGRQRDRPLLVGSVKANISHLEAAGGISGLIKTVLALHHGVLPRQLHFDEPSPHVPWNRLPVKVVTETTPWDSPDERIAGVTALGLYGTNAHVVISSPPCSTEDGSASAAANLEDASEPESRPAELFVLSANKTTALRQAAADLLDFLSENKESSLADVSHTLAAGRRHHECRASIVAGTREDAIVRLKSLMTASNAFEANGHASTTNFKQASNGAAYGHAKRNVRLAWAFPDELAVPIEAPVELFKYEPVFRTAIEEFDERLAGQGLSPRSGGGERLAAWFRGEDADSPSAVHAVAYQAALVALWQSWGVTPDAVGGWGIGQYAATAAAGGLALADAVVLAAKRESLRPTRQDADDLWLSETLDAFESFADGLNYYPPRTPLVCGLTGQLVPVHKSLGGSYWRRHCEAPSRRQETLSALADQEYDLSLWFRSGDAATIESGSADSHGGTSLSCLRDSVSPLASLLAAAGVLYTAGATIDFRGMHAPWRRRKVSLPPYPFQRKRYWITEIEPPAEELTTAGPSSIRG